MMDTIIPWIHSSKQLEEFHSYLVFLFKSSNDAIIAATVKGMITGWNPAAEKIYGYSAEEVIGQSINILAPPNKKDEVDKLIKQLLAGKIIKSFETDRLRKNRQKVYVSLTISPIRDAKGKIIGFSSITRDITDKYKLEDLKQQFLSMIAHELKTPISTLKLLSERHLEKYKKYGADQINLTELKLINHEVDRLNRLINDLLDHARIETEKLALNLKLVNLSKLITQAIAQLRPLAKNHHIKLQYPKEKIQVIVDPQRIEQVLTNLINNAIKHSPKGSIIEIGIKKKKTNAEVAVTDYGEGISKEDLPHIFKRFYQAEQEKKEGFGLGLYISSEIIKKHHGKMWVKSRLGTGSTFFFTIPLFTSSS